MPDTQGGAEARDLGTLASALALLVAPEGSKGGLMDMRRDSAQLDSLEGRSEPALHQLVCTRP